MRDDIRLSQLRQTDPQDAICAPGDHPPARSLYLHIPFCEHKCHYCDFYSIVDSRDRQEAFTARLIEELEVVAPHAAGAPLRTIFIGGGTPSMLRLDLWEQLLGAINDRFDLALIKTGREERPEPAEWTVECNPESTTPELMALLRAGGVDRVSFGAQSFHSAHLKTLERLHSPGRVEAAIEIARDAGIERRSIDLIFAIPDQTIAEWEADLDKAIALGVDHLSAYALTYEPNTAMTQRLSAGRFDAADEDDEAAMYELCTQRLRDAGLERYEVSNHARPGEASRHNLAYWRQEQWLAAGPSASGHLFAGEDEQAGDRGSWRWRNEPHLGRYLDSEGPAPVAEVEAPDPARFVREALMMGVRLSEGLDAQRMTGLAAGACPGAGASLQACAERLASEGLLTLDDQRWRPTERGFLLGDQVASELMSCVEPAGGVGGEG